MNNIDSARKVAMICAACVIINVTGSFIAQSFNLPIYLDTYGTVFVAALGGYVPGVAVGFFTNLIGSLFKMSEMYFGIVNILVAILTTFFCKRGYYGRFSKVLLTIPLTVLLTSCLGASIEELVYLAEPFDSFEKFWSKFQDNFLIELPDKGLAILTAFFLIKAVPDGLKEKFLLLGKMQAPLSEEMRDELKKTGLSDKDLAIMIAFFLIKAFPDGLKKKFLLLGKMQAPLSEEMRDELNNKDKFVKSLKNRFISSLRTKMIFNLIAVTLLAAISISTISYMMYKESIISDRKRIADGIISMAVNEIDPKRVDEFLELGYTAEGYRDVERKLYKIRASNSDIKFLYVYKIMEDGCHTVFDLDTPNMPGSTPGELVEFDESFKPYLPDLLAGRPIPPIISNDKFGYLLTIYKPVYNSVGKCVCYAGVDFSMDIITDYGRMFIAKVVALFSGLLIFIFVLGLMFIENNIILPVNTMAYCAKNFAYDSEEARAQNIERIKSLEIKTNDEIENLYSAFLKTTSDSMNNFENLKRSKIQLAVMDELAHTDSLTGIKNKTAYTEATTRLDAEIAAGVAEFAIIMIDVNYLKKVNDTYGHERGNEYLINACMLACSVFGEGNVYRVGGDEFVVILDGENLAHCEAMVSRLRGMIEKFRADKTLEPWEKVSAAVGVAHYRAGVDKTADEVFKRADSDMYQNKLAMKATRRD